MYPPVGIGQVRVSASHDITLADRLHLPAGTCIWVPHHAIQNVSFNWDDHDKFKPGVPSYCGLALCRLCEAQGGSNAVLWVSCPCVMILPASDTRLVPSGKAAAYHTQEANCCIFGSGSTWKGTQQVLGTELGTGKFYEGR